MDAGGVGSRETGKVSGADGHRNGGVDECDVVVIEITVAAVVLTAGEIGDRAVVTTREGGEEPGVFLEEALAPVVEERHGEL